MSTATGSLLAWRNWVRDSTLTSNNTWEAQAPLDNLKTPQLGEIARRTGAGIGVHFRATFTEDRPVQLVSLLNHNIPEDTVISISLRDASNNVVASYVDLDIWVPPNDDYVRNFYYVFPSPVTARSVQIVSTWVHSFPFQAGALWCSPIFSLPIDSRIALGMGENLQSLTTDANQTRTNPQARFRTLGVTYNGLKESDANGIDPDGTRKLVPYANLQDMFAYACNSRPVILLPVLTSMERIHKYGIYGYLQGQLQLQMNQTGGDIVPDRHSVTINVRESK